MAFDIPFFKFNVDASEVLKVYRRFPVKAERELWDALKHFKLKFFKTWPLKSKKDLKSGKGGMIKRFQGFVNRGRPRPGGARSLNALSIRIMTRSDVAETHEKGKTIHGKRGRMRIPIPGGPAMSKSGRVKKPFRWDPETNRVHSREIENLVPIKGKNDELYLAKKLKSGKIKPMFILKRRVRIQPGLKFEDTFTSLQPFMIDRIDLALDRAAQRS